MKDSKEIEQDIIQPQSLPNVDPINAALETIRQVKQSKVENCIREIQTALLRYNCKLDVKVLISESGILPQVEVLPIE